MERGYVGNKNGYTNPDYQLEDIQTQAPFQYQDDSKQMYDVTASHMHAASGNMVKDELLEGEDSPYPTTGHDSLKRVAMHLARVMLTTFLGAFILGIPLIITRNEAYADSSDDAIQNKNFVFWLFVWLLTTWATGAAAHLLAMAFPYIFYFIAKFVNPAHRRYWRVFRPLKKPFVFLMVVIFGYVWFNVFVELNPNCLYILIGDIQSIANANNGTLTYVDDSGNNQTVSAASFGSDRTVALNAVYTVDQIILNSTFWAVGYLFVKILIVYISIHYHYRSDHARIERSKSLIEACTRLYEISVSRHELYGNKFQEHDIIIRDAVAAGHRSGRDALKFFQKIGGVSSKVLSAFGNLLGSGDKSHWLKPGSAYAIVEHALERPASAHALARRLWLPLVPHGEKALTKEHIANALPLDQKAEADAIMKALDENENGDIRLTEMEPMLVEAGKSRLNIYRNMQSIDHAINTLDWILILWMTAFILMIVLVSYVALLKSLKDIFGFAGLGLGVVVSSLVGDFIRGTVFILFKHPFDIGDRLDLYNIAENNTVGVTVKKVSLLYCVFERTDTGAMVQFPNSRLDLKRIENLTRSGNGTEKLKLVLNINTSFKDLEKLRDEMKAFVTDPENSRDYKSNVALRVKNIFDLDKMEVVMLIGHKANWSNDGLKSARSSRLYCRLIEITRMIPLHRPNGGVAMLGDEGKPNYMVVVSEEEANAKRNEDKNKLLKKRYDYDHVNIVGLDEEQKKTKEAELKAEEAGAYKGLAAIPATITGRAGDRPEGRAAKHPEANSTSVQYVDNIRSRSRPLMSGNNGSSEHASYDDSYAYQNVPAPPQVYNAPGPNMGPDDGGKGRRF